MHKFLQESDDFTYNIIRYCYISYVLYFFYVRLKFY